MIVVTVTYSLPDMSHFISEVIRKPLCQGSRRHKRWHVSGPSVTHDVLCYMKELFLISSANSNLFRKIFAFRSEQQAVESHTFRPVCLPMYFQPSSQPSSLKLTSITCLLSECIGKPRRVRSQRHSSLLQWGVVSASSRIRFLPVQAQPTAAPSSRRRPAARSSHWAIF